MEKENLKNYKNYEQLYSYYNPDPLAPPGHSSETIIIKTEQPVHQ
jgi:hypothetical protein